MKVIVVKKEPFGITQHENVTNIALTSGNYVLTIGSNTATYSTANYSIMVL